jgi:hypothetical protein
MTLMLQGERAKRNDVVEELSHEDIEIFLENESVMAAQTSSQEVRSHHVPHINQVFDTHDASFDFYNTYSKIIGFLAKKAGNYHCRLPGRNNEVTRYTFKCNRSGKPVDDEILEERKRKKELKRQDAKKKKLQEKGEAESSKSLVDQPRKRKRNPIEKTCCKA